jgi:riboflavin synthase
MFTGIIEEVGEIAEIADSGDFRTVRVRARRILEGIQAGASISVNGVCLTARSIHNDGFTADLSRKGDDYRLEVEFPESALRYIVEKGSISVDGISLTISRVKPYVFEVAIIPHTFDNTNLQRAQAGDPVNLEFDVIAKYVERMLKNRP